MYRFGNLLCALLLLPLLTGCDFFQAGVPVHLELPPFPEAWRSWGEPAFEMWWIGSDGVARTRLLPPGSRSAEIVLSRYPYTPIVATPRAGTHLLTRLKPAGAVYPVSAGSSNTVHVRWADGAAALVLSRYLLHAARAGVEESVAAAGLNVRRFMEESRRRLGSSPWRMEIERAVEKLTQASFRESYLDPGPLYTLVVPNAGGVWVSDNALHAVAGESASPPERELAVKLPCGFHRFIHKESGERMDVQVREEGELSLVRYGP